MFGNNNTRYMKKIIHTIILIFLCTAAFSQNTDPADFGGSNDDNPTDQPAVPIDTQLPVLLIAAIFFGIYVIARKKDSPLKRFTN
jgi:hypothetical protein